MSPAEIQQPERTQQSLAVLCNEQTRLMLAQNAATLGRLAAALSHEMNTPLGVLKSSADTLLTLAARNAAPAGVSADLLRAIRESADRLSEVVARMQRFTNLNRAEVQEMCLNGLISDAAGLLDPEVRAGIEFSLEAGLPYVMGHPQQLSAVFLMLLNNAVDSDGSVRVITWADSDRVNVEVRDDGRGIPEHLLSEIFEPSFREHNGRMAAGHWNLFSCRHIVEAHGGHIQIASVEGEGSTVRITLPAAHALG
jgi:signal transduction histidine kinase